MTPFEEDIRDVINKHSRENNSGTPDFLLAQFIEGCLSSFERVTREREVWHGRPDPVSGDA